MQFLKKYGNNIYSMAWVSKRGALYGSDRYDYFGSSVSMTPDGTTVAVGAKYSDGENNTKYSAGSVTIYTYNGSEWVQKGQTIHGVEGRLYLGGVVSLSSDGSTVALSSPYASPGTAGMSWWWAYVSGRYAKGHIVVYTYNGSEWVQKGQTFTGDKMFDYFGQAVSLTSDGSTLAFGAPGNNNGTTRAAGMAVVYTYNGSEWVQKGQTIRGQDWYDFFGSSVRMTSDGTTLAVGARYSDGENNTKYSAGSVTIYTYNGSEWVQKGQTIHGEKYRDYLGETLSLSSDGSTVVVSGMYAYDGWKYAAGVVVVYTYNGSEWVQKGQTIRGDQYFGFLGASTDISSDGSIIAVGEKYDRLYDSGGTKWYAGSVSVYEYDGSEWVIAGQTLNAERSYDYFGTSLSLSGNGKSLVVGATGYDDYSNGKWNAGSVKFYDFVFTDMLPNYSSEILEAATTYKNITPSPETLLTQSNEYLTRIEPLLTRDYYVPDILESAIEETQGYYDTTESSVQTTQGLLTDIEQNIVKAEGYKADIDNWLSENSLTSTITNTVRRPYTTLLVGQNELSQTKATTQIQLASLEANKETMAVLNSQISAIQVRVCFPGNTPVLTDQGEMNINQLVAGKHTINGKKIKHITKVTSPDSTLTCIRRNAIDEGVPSRKTVMTNDHPVEFHGEMVQAGELVDMVEGAFKIRYNGEPVYNVVMENKDTMMVNGLRCETVDPRSKAFISMMLMERVSKEQDPAKRVKLGMAMRKVLKKMKLEDIRILSERRMRELRAQKLN